MIPTPSHYPVHLKLHKIVSIVNINTFLATILTGMRSQVQNVRVMRVGNVTTVRTYTDLVQILSAQLRVIHVQVLLFLVAIQPVLAPECLQAELTLEVSRLRVLSGMLGQVFLPFEPVATLVASKRQIPVHLRLVNAQVGLGVKVTATAGTRNPLDTVVAQFMLT